MALHAYNEQVILFQYFVSFSISPVVIIYTSAENPYIIVVVFKIIITISPSCYIFHCEKFLYVYKVLVPKITHILIELNPTWIGILVLHGVVIIRARSSLVIHLVKVWVSRRVIILYCNEIVLFILFFVLVYDCKNEYKGCVCTLLFHLFVFKRNIK